MNSSDCGVASASTRSPIIYSLAGTTMFQSSDGDALVSVPNSSLENLGARFPAAEPHEDCPNLQRPFLGPKPPTVTDLSHLPTSEIFNIYFASKKYGILAGVQISTQAILTSPQELLGMALTEYCGLLSNPNLDQFAHMCISLPLGDVLRAIPSEYHCSWIYYSDSWSTLWKSSLDATRHIHPADSNCRFAQALGNYAYDMLKLKPPLPGTWKKNIPFPFGIFAHGLGPDMVLPLCCASGFNIWVENGEKSSLELPSFSQVLAMKPKFGTQKLVPHQSP
ncbi:hypothetical protein CVT24_010124 [Panaeolus cyanescens]|uniref:Uncharacterized protein n=1 Tax=Panaeolus cyanescens TaxID=181874 RepID=A0A409WMM0_9AGAR|nr:hypothetical protein CVT24_010124 [Panaeolus cyanescens]